jgi:hypothetical protein
MRDDAAPPASRAIVAVTPVRGGCVEVALECGHRIRRRFGLCVPSRVACPLCGRARPAVAEPAAPSQTAGSG